MSTVNMPNRIEYISPSRLALFKRSPEDFYIRYLTKRRLPDEPQTPPMAVGSAFDAYVKSALHVSLFGKAKRPEFEFDALFEAQVDAAQRDMALDAGKYVFEKYKEYGAYNDLLLELQQAVNEPRFEIEVKGVVAGYRDGMIDTRHGVTFLGKPDVFFTNKHGVNTIYDWKVNGYFSNTLVSPMKGYLRLRESKTFHTSHKDCVASMFQGTMINIGHYLEYFKEDWATQLAVYGWLCGANVGEEFIVGIDQLCCGPDPTSAYPRIRVAEHRLRISQKFQHETFQFARELWEVVHSDHFFRDLTKEESQSRCALLDSQFEGYDPKNEEDRAFFEMTRKKGWY